MAKKKESKVQDLEVVNSSEVVDILSQLDSGRIEKIQKELDALKGEMSTKVYAVKFENAEGLETAKDFMENEAEWSNNESLGVIEVCKVLNKTKIEKDNVIFIESMPLQAIHYFLSKQKGTGLEEANRFISIYKPFSIALESVKKDNERIAFLEKDLAAAQQGIEAI